MFRLAGKKISKRHTTIIEEAIPIVKALGKLPAVNNIVLSIIRKKLLKKTKIEDINGGIKIMMKGVNTQDILVYCKDKEEVKKHIEKYLE